MKKSTFEMVMDEIEKIINMNKNRHNKKSKIVGVFKEIVKELDIEKETTHFLCNYLMYLHKKWVGLSFREKSVLIGKGNVVKWELYHMMKKFCSENTVNKAFITHFDCLHTSIWRALQNNVELYNKKTEYINSGFKSFRKTFENSTIEGFLV